MLAAFHFLLQTKNDVTQPVIMTGLLFWLLGYRILQRRYREVSLLQLAGLAVAAAALTGPFESAWYYFRSSVPFERIFLANFDFAYVIRPMWWVLAAGLAIVVAAALWRLRPQKAKARPAKVAAGFASGRVSS
jgi:sulfoxide reductase heme-binding subunit YedZ